MRTLSMRPHRKGCGNDNLEEGCALLMRRSEQTPIALVSPSATKPETLMNHESSTDVSGKQQRPFSGPEEEEKRDSDLNQTAQDPGIHYRVT